MLNFSHSLPSVRLIVWVKRLSLPSGTFMVVQYRFFRGNCMGGKTMKSITKSFLNCSTKMLRIIGIIVALSLSWDGALIFAQPRDLVTRPASGTFYADTKAADFQRQKEYFNKTVESMKITETTKNKLKAAGIETMADLRKKGNLKEVKELREIPETEIEELRKASLLSLLSDNIELNGRLAKKEINTVRDLEKLSVKDFIDISGGKLDENQAKTKKVHPTFQWVIC
jgi:hypothetical protein